MMPRVESLVRGSRVALLKMQMHGWLFKTRYELKMYAIGSITLDKHMHMVFLLFLLLARLALAYIG
jgi:hypothetical protein